MVPEDPADESDTNAAGSRALPLLHAGAAIRPPWRPGLGFSDGPCRWPKKLIWSSACCLLCVCGGHFDRVSPTTTSDLGLKTQFGLREGPRRRRRLIQMTPRLPKTASSDAATSSHRIAVLTVSSATTTRTIQHTTTTRRPDLVADTVSPYTTRATGWLDPAWMDGRRRALVVLCGLPGAGKTTLARRLEAWLGRDGGVDKPVVRGRRSNRIE